MFVRSASAAGEAVDRYSSKIDKAVPKAAPIDRYSSKIDKHSTMGYKTKGKGKTKAQGKGVGSK